jgi:hypothetical protein
LNGRCLDVFVDVWRCHGLAFWCEISRADPGMRTRFHG